jgi:ankyrin repeat protein
MRPGRSWSLGKNNILSPLTDQVAPAPCEPRDTGGSHKSDNGTDEIDGQTHSSVEKTPSGWEKVKRKEGEGEGEGGESEEEERDVVREELEDTLKAIDHQKRNMSSPPGISCEEDSDRLDTLSEMEAVQLKSKIHMSRSMDTISKRDSLQRPSSPLVMRRFDFPPTPTHTTSSSNRTSKISTSSTGTLPRARQSLMIQSVLVGERSDTTLRRRHIIEEYSPLHKACRDGNVGALWEMLNGPVIADLEEPTFGATPFTPLFLAFFNDHYQTVECLLQHGANPTATEPVNRAPVLHLACERGCSDMVDLLLAYSAEVNQVDSRGNTALWQASRNGHLDIVEKLLEKGALVNAEGENHRSPLHEAASAGHVPIVELLIKEGANPCHRDNHDATPYDLAYVEGHTEVMQVLQALLPEAIRPYSLLHTHTPDRNQMVTSLVFTDNDTLVSGSRDCHATFWEMEEKLSVRQRVRQQDSVLGVEKWEEHLVVSSCFVTLESLDETNQRRIVADDTQEDESLTNPPLHFASFGPDGMLVTASVEGHVVKVWPPMASQTAIAVQPQARLTVGGSKETAQPGFIHSLSVSRSADHPWLAVGLQPGSLFQPQGNKTVHLYNWEERKVHQIFDAGSGGPSVTVHTAFSPCGRQLAIGCHENLCIWEPLTGDLLYKFTTAKKLAVTSLSYTPNGAHLAVGLASGEVQVFDIESSSCIFTLEPHNEYPSAASALAYSENGQRLAIGHRNGQIQIWRANTGPISS